MEYIRADDIENIIYDIEPSHSSYFGQGIAEQMVLDKQQEIVDMLKELEIVDIDED